MNLLLAALLIVGSVLGMTALMLGLRRLAPEGGYFRDSERAASVFNVLGTGFAIMLGFVVLLTFESYSNAKRKAEQEANAVFEQYEAAQLISPPRLGHRLQGDLVCYARSVIGREWPEMRHGRASGVTEHWLAAMEMHLPRASVPGGGAGPAYTEWFARANLRDDGRRERLLEAQSVLPALLWVMLILGAVVVVCFVFFYADPEERALGQAAFSGGVTAIVVVSLLAVAMLAAPFRNENGSIRPTGMGYTLHLIEQEQAALHDRVTVPCDASGAPSAAGLRDA
jgi:hypothetical protein